MDLHCLHRQGLSGFSRTRDNTYSKKTGNKIMLSWVQLQQKLVKKFIPFYIWNKKILQVSKYVCCNGNKWAHLAHQEKRSLGGYAAIQQFQRLCCPLQNHWIFWWIRKALITKTYLYNVDPLKPHFNIVKLGFTGVYNIFSYFCSNT